MILFTEESVGWREQSQEGEKLGAGAGVIVVGSAER